MFPVDELTRWMDARGLGTGAIGDVETLVGGTQNILLRFGRGGLSMCCAGRRRTSVRTATRRCGARHRLSAPFGIAVPHPLIAAEADVM